MEPEEIGSLNVNIGGDYSDLVKAFAEAQSAAQTAGKDVADSFTTAAEGEKRLETAFASLTGEALTYQDALQQMVASGASAEESAAALAQVFATLTEEEARAQQGVGEVGASAAQSAQQLDLFGAAAEDIPFADVNGQLSLFATNLEEFSNAAGAASQETVDFYESLNGFSDAAQSVIDREADMQANTAQAAATLSELWQGFEQGTVTAEQLALAQDDLAKAQGSVADSGKDAGLSVEGLIEAGLKLAGLELGINTLKELALTALEVAAGQEKLVISLEALTGSAQVAYERLQLIEGISFKNALDIDTVEAVTQKMAAFGLSADQTRRALQSAADAAAATGGSFEATASKIENMAKSGMAGSRQLVALGLSSEDLGKIMGKTGADVAAAFKEMDESQRLTVLTEALDKFKGLGEKTADSLTGKWQNFKNDWHNILEGAGGDLSEFAKAIISIADTGLKAFGEALKAVEETAHNVGEAIGAVTSTVGGMASAVGQLTGVLGPFKSAWDAAWQFVKDYNAYHLAKEALDEIALGVQTLTGKQPAVEEMGKSLDAALKILEDHGPKGVEAIAALDASFKNAADAQQGFAAMSHGAVTAIDNIVKASTEQAHAYQDAKTAYDATVKSLQEGTPLYRNHVLTLADGTKVFKDHVATLQDVAVALQQVTETATHVAGPIDQTTIAMANASVQARQAGQAYETAKGVYQTLVAAFNAGNATFAQVTAAYDKMTAAEKAAADAGAPIPGTIEAISLAAKQAATGFESLASSAQISTAQTTAQSDSMTLLANHSIEANQKLVLLTAAQHDLEAAVSAGRATQAQALDMMRAVTAAADDARNAQRAFATAAIEADNAAALEDGSIGLLSQSLALANEKLTEADEDYRRGAIGAAQFQSAEKAVLAATIALHAAEVEANANRSRSTELWAAIEVTLAQAKQKLDDVTAAYRNQLASIQDVTSAQNAYMAAQMAANREAAIAATGTVGLTDKYSLLRQVLAGAQADYDTLSAAVATGRVRAEELLAAQDKVISASNNLADAQKSLRQQVDGSNSSLRDQVTVHSNVQGAHSQTRQRVEETTHAFEDNTAAAREGSTALEDLANWAEHAGEEFGSLSKDIQDLTGDLLGLDKAKSKSASLSAPEGYYFQTSGNAFTGFKVDLRPIPEGMEIGPAGTPIPIPGYDWNKGTGGGSSSPAATSSPAPTTATDNGDALKAAQNQFLLTALNAAEMQASQAKVAFENGTGSAEALADARQLVRSAQAALDTFTGGKSASSGGGNITTGATDTAAAGGTYPGVVIHQAAGEVLLVALTSSPNQGGGAVADSTGLSSSVQAASAAALAASSTSLTVSTAAGTMANVVGALQDLTGVIAGTVEQAQQIASRLALVPIATPSSNYTGNSVGGTVTGNPSKNTSVGAGMGNTVGQTITVGSSGYPTGGSLDYLASIGVPTPAASGNSGGNIEVTVTGNTFTGVSAADMAGQVQSLVNEGMTRVLRDSGARY